VSPGSRAYDSAIVSPELLAATPSPAITSDMSLPDDTTTS
jgi:hypothetical protein